ncbi:MAG: excinuclease ABC subunit UvrC [Alphaproteobacteria bacterium]|nr:excinuclease ABC subunit UvrC [Alphaproteobacteria bacterium]
MTKADKPATPDLAALPADAEAAARPLRGVDAIRDACRLLPQKPGVYRMLAADGAVLYVGKARNLRARVSQYAQGRAHANQIYRMITQTAAVEVIVTATETEALLLEVNMIKRLKPRFNVIMRDDKSFPFILIRMDHQAPALEKHRGAKRAKGRYFGPFASAGAVNRTLNTLQKAFLLRSCSDSVFSARTRPCMLHQIKRCSAPCVGLVNETEYRGLTDDALDFLTGKSVELQERLARDMHAAADALEFENAARLRNRIRALAAVRAQQGVNPATFDEADVFALAMEGGYSCIQVFFFRAGQNWGNRAYFPRHEKELEPAEILESFIGQFYDGQEPPRLVLASHPIKERDLLEAALTTRAERRIEIRTPERGEKKDIVEQAAMNAREALARRLADTQSVARLMAGVAETFDLPAPPERIEVYDNSHIQGTNAVGAMIVAGPDGFEKNQYRKFNIKSADLTPGDDYAMMREVLRRRFARLAPPTPSPQGGGEDDPYQDDRAGRVADGGVDFSKAKDEEPDQKFGRWPDLVLIDGGEGQLAAAHDALREAGLAGRILLVGVAKGVERDAGRERFFIRGRAPFRLEERSPVLYYLQRLRDEAHRYAIGAHRQKRKADMTKNPLDDIGGVGPARKRALLARFGSARGVARANLAELLEVEGVNDSLARRIYGFFRDGG